MTISKSADAKGRVPRKEMGKVWSFTIPGGVAEGNEKNHTAFLEKYFLSEHVGFSLKGSKRIFDFNNAKGVLGSLKV